jgi:hypothetical protein
LHSDDDCSTGQKRDRNRKDGKQLGHVDPSDQHLLQLSAAAG